MSEFVEFPDSEYNHKFDRLRQNRMAVSFYKYGPIRENYGNKLVKAIPELEERLELYKETGNTEYLVDVANFAMIEFTFPSHEKAHFDNLSKSPGLKSKCFRELQE